MQLILALCMLCISLHLTAQEGMSYHFYPELAQQNILNAKVDSARSYTISAMGYTHILSNGFSLGDVSTLNGNERTIDLDLAKDKINDINLQEFSSELNILHIEYYLKRLTLKAGYNQKNFLQVSYPKELYQLMANGNAQFIGQAVSLDPVSEINAYHEIYLGYGLDFGKLSLGANFKFLSGISNLHTAKNNLQLATSDDIYQLELQADYELQTSGVLNYTSYDDVVLEFNRTGFSSPFIGNYGYGLDLGLDFDLNEDTRIFASVQNLGTIKWDLRGTSYSSEGSFNYDGIDVIDYIRLEDGASFRDSLEALLQVAEADLDYNVSTPVQYLAGLQYYLGNGLDLGALVTSRTIAGENDTAIALHARKKIKPWLTLGSSYTNRFSTYENLGLSAMIEWRNIRALVLTENILSVFDPLGKRNFSLGGGITFGF